MRAIAIGMLCLGLGVTVDTPASAQTRSTRDTATAYGARLNSKGQPADLNQARINNRIPSRIDNRLSLRIERYRPESTDNPTAAFDTQPTQTDKTRTAPVLAPLPQQDDTGL